MVAQKQRPLTAARDVRGLAQDVGDRFEFEDFTEAIRDFGIRTIRIRIIVLVPEKFFNAVEILLIGLFGMVMPDAFAPPITDRMLASQGAEIQFPIGMVVLQVSEHGGHLD